MMTTDILHTIVAHKRTEIALQEEAVSQDFLIQQLGTPRPSKSMKQILKRIFHHEELTREEACTLMQRMTGGEMNEAQTAALLAAFQMRGVKVDELVGFRDALLQACVPVDLHEFHSIDIVGTGGDGKNTFNISTCACFVVAGAGYRVRNLRRVARAFPLSSDSLASATHSSIFF
jgi:hypothetical protein